MSNGSPVLDTPEVAKLKNQGCFNQVYQEFKASEYLFLKA